MKRYAYLATGRMIALMESFSRIRVIIHGQEHIPAGSIIFVVNHFTRIETLLLPYHIHKLTGVPVWSLADHSFFEGPFSGFLNRVGAVSTRHPDRDKLIVKTLLTGEANWIIFPEGHMVKDKGYAGKPRLFWPKSGRRRPPHTGAASLALRTEFFRQRLLRLLGEAPDEVERLRRHFELEAVEPVTGIKTWIVPVNMTYYPLRARENVLSNLADRFADKLTDRLREELLTEGTMFFSGVDIDVRFGQPLDVREFLASSHVEEQMFYPGRLNFDDQLPSPQVMRHVATKLMRRYMADIYDMTTVNHDHLFASLLRALPSRSIAEEDFRRRVFLLASLDLQKMGISCHHSLETGQTALLSDDRFHKYRDFRLLAEETGVVRVENGMLVKDPTKFSSAFDFHRVRIDNPIGVIANEMLPLTTLQHEVHKIAWLPKVLIRRQVVDSLARYALKEFETDYRSFFRPGETKDREVGSPVLLRGKSRELGIVLVHGFLAAPREMAELAAYLNSRGLWVYMVRLKGHGTSADDLATRSGKDWIESVDVGYSIMSSICRRVVMGGFSFGAGLVLDCVSRIGGAAGVFAVCPPLRLQDISSRLAPAVNAWNGLMDLINCHVGKKEFVELTMERPLINYSRLPIVGVMELERFMKGLEQRLAGIQLPALVVQASGDPVVSPSGSKLLFKMLGSKQKEYKPFDINRHGILAGDGSEFVHKAIFDFIERL